MREGDGRIFALMLYFALESTVSCDHHGNRTIYFGRFNQIEAYDSCFVANQADPVAVMLTLELEHQKPRMTS